MSGGPSITAVSRSPSAFLPETSSLPVSSALVADAVVAAPNVVPSENYVQVANAHSEAELAVVARAHSGWARADLVPADGSVALPEHASIPVALWAVDSAPAYLARVDSVGRSAHGSRAGCSQQADPSDQHCSQDAQPVR